MQLKGLIYIRNRKQKRERSMKTDLQIAQEAVMEPIGKVAETLAV